MMRSAALKAAQVFTTPLNPVDYSGLFNPLHGREIRGRISEVKVHGDFTEISIVPGPGLPAKFHAGQFIGLGVHLNGRWQWRCFSLTNAPRRHGRTITLGIKSVPDGAVSSYMSTKAQPGDIVRLTAPGGDFYLPQPLPEKLLFITAGAGITPIMSMLRWLRQESSQGFPKLIHVHSESDGTAPAPYAEELHKLSSEQPNYHLVLWNSSERGHLNASTLQDLVADATTRERFACGPQGLLDSLTSEMPGTHVERFFTATETGVSEGGVVEFKNDHVRTECDSSTTILEAAEAAGVQLTHGCRMGICHTCVATVEEGNAVDIRTGATHGEGERVRTCSAIPSGDVCISQN